MKRDSETLLAFHRQFSIMVPTLKPIKLLALTAAAFMTVALMAQETLPPTAENPDETAKAEASTSEQGPPPGEPAGTPQKPVPIAIEIDLTAQKAWLLQDGQRVYE